MKNQKLLKIFHRVGMAEGVSFLLLLGIAMPLKYMMDWPMGVSVVGMAHGILFIAYLYCLYECHTTFSWPLRTTIMGALASVLPFGPFIFDRKINAQYGQA